MLGPMCGVCRTITAAMFLLLGLALLLVDLHKWSFFGINWWTGLFIVIGVTSLGSCICKNCKAMGK